MQLIFADWLCNDASGIETQPVVFDCLVEYLTEDPDNAFGFRIAEAKEIQVARGPEGIIKPSRVKHRALEDKAIIVRRDA